MSKPPRRSDLIHVPTPREQATGVAALYQPRCPRSAGHREFHDLPPVDGRPCPDHLAYAPRWQLPYQPITEKRLAPSATLLRGARAGQLTAAEFDERYLDQVLDPGTGYGPFPCIALSEALKRIRLGAGKRAGSRLVLLCFEKPGENCHRRTLADWLQSNNIACPELDPNRP